MHMLMVHRQLAADGFRAGCRARSQSEPPHQWRKPPSSLGHLSTDETTSVAEATLAPLDPAGPHSRASQDGGINHAMPSQARASIGAQGHHRLPGLFDTTAVVHECAAGPGQQESARSSLLHHRPFILASQVIEKLSRWHPTITSLVSCCRLFQVHLRLPLIRRPIHPLQARSAASSGEGP